VEEAVSKTPAGRTASDAELGARILAGWERMSRAVADGPRHNRRLAAHFGVGLRDIEHVRDTRNRVAHPGETIHRTDLERAVAIIRRADRRSGPRESTRPARRRPRTSRPKRAPERPARSKFKTRFGSVAISVALLVIVGAAILLWLTVF
jgi:hypothetical protein